MSVLAVFGFDSSFLSWVDEDADRRLIFIDENERSFADPRIQIFVLESPLQIEFLAKKVAWAAAMKKLDIVLIEKGEAGRRFEQAVARAHLGAHLLLSESSDFWVGALQNARKNRGVARRALGLQGTFAKWPAIVVGAGPSLKKNGHLLKAFENRALIMAGGSALNGIEMTPHFAASIDKEAPYKQFKMHPFFEAPFCYQARMNPDNFSLIHGEKLLFPDSSLPAINWLQGDEELFDGGWTVGNFLTAFAVCLGCSPVIFVGMDFGYEEGRKYAYGDAEAGELIFANGVWTQRDWLMAAKWTEDLAARSDSVLINATEGGMKMAIREEKLSDLLELLPEREDMRESIHEAIQKLPLVAVDRFEEWDESLQRCKQGAFEGEIVQEKLLNPLWQIWKPLFERETALNKNLKIHQTLFFEKVLQEHG